MVFESRFLNCSEARNTGLKLATTRLSICMDNDVFVRPGWLPPLVAVALALAAGGSARADVCVVVNPVLDIGCREGQGAPAGGEPAAFGGDRHFGQAG